MSSWQQGNHICVSWMSTKQCYIGCSWVRRFGGEFRPKGWAVSSLALKAFPASEPWGMLGILCMGGRLCSAGRLGGPPPVGATTLPSAPGRPRGPPCSTCVELPTHFLAPPWLGSVGALAFNGSSLMLLFLAMSESLFRLCISCLLSPLGTRMCCPAGSMKWMDLSGSTL